MQIQAAIDWMRGWLADHPRCDSWDVRVCEDVYRHPGMIEVRMWKSHPNRTRAVWAVFDPDHCLRLGDIVGAKMDSLLSRLND